jgi:hypothetical protein
VADSGPRNVPKGVRFAAAALAYTSLNSGRYKGGVRVLAALCTTLAAVAAFAGCGNDSDPVWGGPQEAQSGGAVSTEGFSDFQREVDEDWERSPAMAAAVFLRLDERRATRTSIDAEAGPEGGGNQTVVVTLDGLGDDSVRTERWTLGFVEGDDGVYALTDALRELRCHEGRGHQDFAGDACI